MQKIIFVFFFFLFFIQNITQANEKIVFIDINFIFNNSDAGKDLQTLISKKKMELELEINQFKIEIDDKKKKILSQKNVLSIEEYNKKIVNLDKEVKDINTNISKKRNELETYQKKIENAFSISINNLIEEYSVKNSIDIVFNKSNLLMAKKNFDITEKIFNLFNERVKTININ